MSLPIFSLSWILIILFFYFDFSRIKLAYFGGKTAESNLLYFKKPKYLKKIIITGIFLFFVLSLVILISQSFSTYFSWKHGPIGKYFIPPYKSIFYFFIYCFTNYYSNFLLTIGGSFSVGLLFWIFKEENRIDSLEMWLAILAAFFSGWPNLIIFLGLILLLAIFYSFIQNYIKREKKRIFLFFPIIIACLITILFGNFMAKYLGISVLKM